MALALDSSEAPSGDKEAIIRTIIGLILPNYPIDEGVQDGGELPAEAV